MTTCLCSSDMSLCKPLTLKPDREVFAFTTSKEDYKSPNWDWNSTTTVATFFSGDFPTDLVCLAHAADARVVLGADADKSQLGNATYRTEWVQGQLATVQQLGADGVNVDIEGNSDHRDDLTALIKELAETFHEAIPGSQITFDTGIYPLAQANGYDHKALAEHLDFFVPMGYDMCWATTEATANSPIEGVRSGIHDYLHNLSISASQIVVGLPWYGWDFPCDDDTGPGCKVTPPAGQDWYGWATQIGYSAVMNNSAFVSYDNTTMTAIKEWRDLNGTAHQIWYDDPTTLTNKYGVARDEGLLGVAFWTADEADYSVDGGVQAKDMWQAVVDGFLS